MEASVELHKFAIPPMMIQLLVENAVKHGIEQSIGRSILSLQVAAQDLTLWVRVCNSYDNTRSAWTPGTGTGLNNIRQRLQLLYGNSARLDVEKSEQQFKVILTLPKEVP